SYVGPENIVNDDWETSDEVDITVRLLKAVLNKYSIDENRLYTTGQSMGGMVSFYLNSKYTDLFAASIFVGSQWDINVLAPLANDKFFYIVSAGDPKASGGMRELGALLKKKGVSYGETEFSAKLPQNEQEKLIHDLLRQGHRINFVQFSKNTVIPEGTHDRGGEHLYSFDYAYQLKAKGSSAKDDKSAFTFYLQSAQLGYGPAQDKVGYAYQHGKGVARDIKEAVKWYRKALERGVERSRLNLGIIYLTSEGIMKNYENALKLFTQSCQHGDMKAPRYLGIMYEDGLGVKMDYAKAYEYYKAASDAGDITAAARLGYLCERGLGVEQSYSEA
ncbi:SEL1-like repeat protein, partial [Aduncisulcus paluster]